MLRSELQGASHHSEQSALQATPQPKVHAAPKRLPASGSMSHRDRRTKVMTAARTSLLNVGHAFTNSARSLTLGAASVLSGVLGFDTSAQDCSSLIVSTLPLLPSSLFARSILGEPPGTTLAVFSCLIGTESAIARERLNTRLEEVRPKVSSNVCGL